MSKAAPCTPRVTDHALLRFLERAGGMDVEGLRDALSTSLARATRAAQQIGGGHYQIIADELIYVMRDNRLITVLPDGGMRDHVRASVHSSRGHEVG